MSTATSLNNYEYLDILDRAWDEPGTARPSGGVVCDVGCASFWYAAALHAFFQPCELVGIEVEGYRRFRNGHARIDHAAGYVAQLPATRFVVADYANCELPADIITCWFPFVTPRATLAWRLPLSLLAPHRLFARIAANLRSDGTFVMVNHGEREAALAAEYCTAAGLSRQRLQATQGMLSHRRQAPAILSSWQHRRRPGA